MDRRVILKKKWYWFYELRFVELNSRRAIVRELKERVRDFATCGVCVPRETASNEKRSRSIFETNAFFSFLFPLPSLDFILMTRSIKHECRWMFRCDVSTFWWIINYCLKFIVENKCRVFRGLFSSLNDFYSMI